MSTQKPVSYLNSEVNVRWYVVANRTEAVLYTDEAKQKFQFVDRLLNEKGALHESELVSDRPGRGFSSSGGDGSVRHALAHRESHHEHVAKEFASRIAASLEAARNQKRFTEIVLVAEPHFLGLLRAALGPATTALVKCEVRHEYTKGSDAEIHAQILKAIAQP